MIENSGYIMHSKSVFLKNLSLEKHGTEEKAG